MNKPNSAPTFHPGRLYHKLVAAGLKARVVSGNLEVWPDQKCSAELQVIIKANQTALVAWLSRPPAPGVLPPELPLNLERPAPSQADAGRVMAAALAQTNGDFDPICAWLVRREDAYFAAVPEWRPEELAYAAARDLVCWQSRLPEAGLLVKLADEDWPPVASAALKAKTVAW